MRFFETIKIQNGKAHNLSWHERRMRGTISRHFGQIPSIDLSQALTPPRSGLFRCKVIYSDKIEKVEYHSYIPRAIRSLRPIQSDIDYSFKYLDRSAIDSLFTQKEECDDILICKDGLVRDTSIANVAFLYQNQWLTPAKPLLEGTTRARFLDIKKLIATDISVKDLTKFDSIALLNAMIGFFELEECIIRQRSEDVVRYFAR